MPTRSTPEQQRHSQTLGDRWNKILCTKGKENYAGVAILTATKVKMLESVEKDERCYVTIKISIQLLWYASLLTN